MILLDCDFRKPSLHKIFEIQIPSEKSLSAYLLAEDTDPADYLIESKKHGITLGIGKNAGRSINRLLNNGKLSTLLQQLREQYDYVILDTPPMLAAADAEALAAMVDTAVLVVRSDYMPTKSINTGLDRLRKSAPEVCGYILNNHHSNLW